MPKMRPKAPATETHGDFDRFSNFVRRLMAVPHSEVKAAMEAEKEAKRTSSSSPDSSASSRKR
jgi:hypothetical protein